MKTSIKKIITGIQYHFNSENTNLYSKTNINLFSKNIGKPLLTHCVAEKGLRMNTELPKIDNIENR